MSREVLLVGADFEKVAVSGTHGYFFPFKRALFEQSRLEVFTVFPDWKVVRVLGS